MKGVFLSCSSCAVFLYWACSSFGVFWI